MTQDSRERTLALAAVIQAASMVHKIAFSESVEAIPLRASVESIFNNNIKNVSDLFSPEEIQSGLEILIKILGSRELLREKLINRYWYSLLYLAGKIRKDKKTASALREEIDHCRRQRDHFGVLHDSTLLRLGEIWQNTVGKYRFKILVVGNNPSLQHSVTAAKIRACLLAGIRAGVLWEQLGGSQWQLMFNKAATVQSAKEILKSYDLESVT